MTDLPKKAKGMYCGRVSCPEALLISVLEDVTIPRLPVWDFTPASPTTPAKNKRRMIIVANRLKVTVKRNSDGTYKFDPSAGGLASGMEGFTKTTKCLWYGWVGLDIPDKDRADLTKRLWSEYEAIPVYVSEKLSEGHYNGFSNEILWPLFHYHPDDVCFEDSAWNDYKEVNRIFAKALAQDAKDGDIIWIQDYHLMLMPAMLRQELQERQPPPKDVKIGFFLHTPFPSSEIYRILPVRKEILEGVLQSDLIGLHAIDYVRHFLNACVKILKLSTTPAGVYYHERFITVQDFPIGIDPPKWTDQLKVHETQIRMTELRKTFQGVKVIVGIDRLDYIKGIQQKLHAFEVLLTDHPDLVGKVKLVQIGVPTRDTVGTYISLRTAINELVGRINGKFGTIEFAPIQFLFQSVAFSELTALYAISDVCLVTSIRDGMNLVSYEYIVCQDQNNGALVLSEFTGAAQSLNGAIVVNPWDTDAVAKALHDAVTMDEHVRRDRRIKMRRRVLTYTSEWWGKRFMDEMMRIATSSQKLERAENVAFLEGKTRDRVSSNPVQRDPRAMQAMEEVATEVDSEEDKENEEKYVTYPTTALPTPQGQYFHDLCSRDNG